MTATVSEMARRKSLGRSIFRLVKRHPYPTAAVALGLLAGYGVDRWLDVTDRTQLIVSVVVVLLMMAARLYLAMQRRGYSAVYVIYGWDPWTGYTTETCIYVGETSQAPWTDRDGVVHYPRLEQHMLGGGRYASEAKSWEDTVTRWYFAYESYRGFKWVRMWHEKRLVHKLRPICNYEYNLRNPRRVPIPEQKVQRADRDAWRLAA